MRRAEILCAAALLLLAAVAIREGLRLSIGWGDIGPRGGFFPFWLAVILGGSSLYTLVQGMQRRDAGEPFLRREAVRPVLTVLVPIAGAVLLIEAVGFYLTSFLYLLGYMRWTGRHAWATTLLISLLFPVVIFLIFERWFLVPLPKGLLEAYHPF
ncbi:MAG: tripartite tricarboxylate transporter TctB family protein [candidate division NC10 bacterium]|nr:tripartite tricarboxylate transporter TctB family protein [candidate division NC10 bacterium]